MSHIITLEMPDSVFQPLLRAAEATKQPVESLLLTNLQASLPSLDGLPSETKHNLEALESLDDEALWRIMLETVSLDQQQRLSELLDVNQSGAITETEHGELSSLQHQADLVMLRKAHAAVLLRFRGKRLPTLAELDHLTASK
ncbi:MAG: hypothetical protein M3X11_10935 [Acidobacteriota bacterium]|nr:hypothetical protein [Acidobacteriota bacterium]